MPNKPLIIPERLPNPEGQAKMILKSNGLQLIQPLFFKVDKGKMNTEQAQKPDLYNWMGLPVFDTVVFDPLNYVDNDAEKTVIKLGGLRLTNCMHVVSMVKNIVKTPIAGADGTVKEYIGLSDYNITLSGWLVSQYANVPPEQEIRDLYEYCKAKKEINVASNFLSYFEIFTIVIEGEPTFTQIEGTRNAIQFTINCVSDKDFAIQYNKNNKGRTSPVSVPSFI